MSRREFLSALAEYPQKKAYATSAQYMLALKQAITVKTNRSERNLLREWATHKLLFGLNISRKRTESVDLNHPQTWYVRLAYFIVGNIALIFYR